MAVGSLVDVVMPQMGVSVSEGTVSRWVKQAGDQVAADETIVEISTDKVDTEVPSPASGVVVEILVGEGVTVPVGTAIARIDTGSGGGSPVTAPPAAAAAPPPAAPAAPPEPVPAPAADTTPAAASEPPAHFGPQTSDGGYVPSAAEAAADVPVVAPTNGADDASMRTFMSPVVARMVAEHGLDITRITGRGHGGRVTKRDVELHLAAASTTPPAAPPTAAAAPPTAAAAPPTAAAAPPTTAAAPTAAAAIQAPTAAVAPPVAAPAITAAPPPVAPAVSAPATDAASLNAAEDLYRFTTIRKAIAKHMMESVLTTAQLTTVIEVDMTRVADYRAHLKAEFAQRHRVGLTFLPFIMKATVEAISHWPWVNAEIRGDEAIIKRYVNLGMAVAVDDSKGLLVPVIRNAESLSMVGLARALTDLADRARTKTLTPDEMRGATFTITNPGGYGALIGTPILPVGTTAIIDVEAIQKRAVVITDETGADAIAIRRMMYLPMTYDHRLVDGAYAAQFLRDLKRNLETWPIDAYIS